MQSTQWGVGGSFNYDWLSVSGSGGDSTVTTVGSDEAFSQYLWGFVDGAPIINRFTHLDQVPAATPLAEMISKDLKKRGFRFVGPTIVYAFMQAVGMVNDHLIDCHRHGAVNAKNG